MRLLKTHKFIAMICLHFPKNSRTLILVTIVVTIIRKMNTLPLHKYNIFSKLHYIDNKILISLPPPCLVVGTTQSGCYSSTLPRLMNVTPGVPNTRYYDTR